MKRGFLVWVLCFLSSIAWAENRPYYPKADGEWETHPLHSAGIDEAKFAHFLDYTFSTGRFSNEPHMTNSLIILLGGRILHEQYRPGFSPPNDKQYLWSFTKSLANGILGRAERKGFITRDTLVREYLSGFDDPKMKNLNLTHLMRMSSGINYYEEHPDTILFSNSIFINYSWRGFEDVASYMVRQGFKYPAGKQFNYSSGDCNLSMALLRKKFDDPSVNEGKDPQTAYNDFPWRELFQKVGMKSTTLEQDGSGNFVAGSFGWSTARDMARFALLYPRNGEWDINYDGEISEEEKLFNRDWVEFSTTVAPTLRDRSFLVDEDGLRLNREAYGGFWWLNEPIEASGNRLPYPNLPESALIAMGYRGQTLVVMPSKNIIIVRLASDGLETKIDRHKFFELFMASFSEDFVPKPHAHKVTTGYDFSDVNKLSVPRIAYFLIRTFDGELVFDDPFAMAPAKDLCSCLFVMRKDQKFCFDDVLQFNLFRDLGLVSEPTIDYQAKSVTVTNRVVPLFDHVPALRLLGPSTHTATARHVNENLGCMISKLTAPWRGPLGVLNIFGDRELTPSVDYFD